jgi:UDP-N-acetylglucosamine acyltransferase
VARDLPPYVIVMGQPAEPRGINLEGLKRRDFSRDQIRNIKSAYKALYMSNLGLEEATKAIEDLGDINGEINTLIDFLKDTTRGIVRKG